MALGLVARAHRSGRSEILVLSARGLDRIPGSRGLPSWSGAPVALTALSLATAVFGFYWDVSTHIDNGRDPGPFANPAHYFILAGLAGIAVGGLPALLLGDDERLPAGVQLSRSWRAPVGGLMLLGCGVIALAGFPLDDVW